jgi:hypothetical protein
MIKPFNNSFEDCRKIEAKGWEDLKRFLLEHARDGQFVMTDKGRLAKELQETIGDGLFNHHKTADLWAFELKTETENLYGNLFLEFWSNRSHFNPGWIFKLNTDLLFYQFLMEQKIYCVNFQKLREWAFWKQGNKTTSGRIFDFPMKKQGKHDQLNDTWGFCVPIKILENEVGLRIVYEPQTRSRG